jgi:benzylsuccinate CoA-transferase BbsF subunit
MKLPLEGIRIIDFTAVWAGPFATRILADFGAEVIKLESIQHYDFVRTAVPPKGERGDEPYNRGGYFHQFNRNKIGLTLNLEDPRGKELFKELVKISDLVFENHAPRVMKNLELDYPVLKEVKPDIIMVSMSGYGQTGPYRNYPGYGNGLDGFSGAYSLLTYGDGIPIPATTPLADPCGALHAAFAGLVALHYRHETGRGQFIDLSQYETLGCIMEEAYLPYTMNGHEPKQLGNKHAFMVPHGYYRCRGDDVWLGIGVRTDLEWQSFCRVIGNPGWTQEERFSTAFERYKNQEDLDRLIEAWTTEQDGYKAMQLLQEAGVAAGIALSGPEILREPHLKARDFFWNINCPDAGSFPFVGCQIKLSETPGNYRLPPPRLGEHNEYVLGKLLGLSSMEMADLRERKIIGDVPLYPPIA